MTTHTHRGNCQRCGAIQAAANVGDRLIAKHGYKVVERGLGGFFLGTCEGSGVAPLQISRTYCDAFCVELEESAKANDAAVERMKRGNWHPRTIVVGTTYNRETRTHDDVRKDWDAATPYEQRRAIEIMIAQAESAARAKRSHVAMLQTLAAEVHGKPMHKAKAKPAPVEIVAGATFIERAERDGVERIVQWTVVRMQHAYRSQRVICRRDSDGREFAISAQRVRAGLRAEL